MEENSVNGPAMDGRHQERSSKRQRRCEPDVTVVVGGVEFQHYSQLLCLSSAYFDAALNSGMKESQDKLVVLSGDWNPEEWKVVSKFFDPLPVHSSAAAAMLTHENIRMLLPWFHYLEMAGMLEACERFLRASTLKDGSVCDRTSACAADGSSLGSSVLVGGFSKGSPGLHLHQAQLVQLCDSFGLCAVYDFEPLMKDIKTHLERIIAQSPDLFTLVSVRALVAAMRASSLDVETKESLWALLKVYIPQHVQETATDGIDTLLVNPLFPTVLLDGMACAVQTKRDLWLPGNFAHAYFSRVQYLSPQTLCHELQTFLPLYHDGGCHDRSSA